MVRRRLTPEQRRNQLLDVGAEHFATNAYEDVSMEAVATAAGVSRGLVYRYFPTKRDLFAAIYQRASERLLDASQLSTVGPLEDQISAGLDAHLDFFVANARTVIEANRGALAGDPVVQDIINSELAELRRRLLDAASLAGPQRAAASTALGGWLAFVRAVCVDWLATQSMSRNELRALCLRSLTVAIGTTTPAPARPRPGTPKRARQRG